MQGARKSALVAILILLAAGHVAYWYWPREHPGRPTRRSPAADVLAADDLPLRAWVAHPHQNLAFLASAESGDNWRQGLAQLAGLPPIELPGFGPFPLPPADELAVATDETGERLRVAARIYPLISWVARAAGRLAGNPWLAGGEVEEGGRRLIVAWEGRTWTLRTPGDEWPKGEVEEDREALALLALEGGSIDPLPAGRYRIVRSGAHLDLLSAAAESDDLVEPEGGVLMVVQRRPEGLRASAVLGPGQGSLRGVPSAVTFAQSDVDLPTLPFERLYRILGVKRRRAQVDGWSLAASDRLALDRGRDLVSGLERSASEHDLALAYTVDLDVVRAVSENLEDTLGGIPLPPIPEVKQWRGAALILTELAAYDRWTLEVAAQGGEVRSRLWRAD